MTTLTAWPARWRRTRARNGATSTYRSAPVPAQEMRDQISALRCQVAAAEARARQLEERLYRDQLTGLRSRTWLMDHWPTEHGDQWPTAVAMIDLDHFKQVNDTYGHAAGDKVLAEVGRRLAAIPEATAVRLHGDEIAVLVWPAVSVNGITAEIGKVFRPTIWISGSQPLEVRASVGLTRVWPGATLRTVLIAADAAMYQAKEGRHTPRHSEEEGQCQ